MSKVISFISRKGGTGKTTNAINLATMLFNLGYKLTLIETDVNYTLSTLRKLELFKTAAKDNNIFKILGSTDEKVLDEINRMKKDIDQDFILVDSAGRTTDSNMKKLCVASDVVVIPTSLSQNDLLVTFQTVEDLKPAKEINEALKLLILPNRVHSQTGRKTIEQSMAELDAFILENTVVMKNAFANFSTILPEKQYLSIAKEIIQHLN